MERLIAESPSEDERASVNASGLGRVTAPRASVSGDSSDPDWHPDSELDFMHGVTDDYETSEEDDVNDAFYLGAQAETDDDEEDDDDDDDDEDDDEELELLNELLQEEIANGATIPSEAEEAGAEGEEGDGVEGDERGVRPREDADTTILLTRAQVMRVLANVDFGNNRLLDSWRSWSSARDRQAQQAQEAEVATRQWRTAMARKAAIDKRDPSRIGRALRNESTFGRDERRRGRIHRTKRPARKVLERELGSPGWGREKSVMTQMKHDMIPEDEADMIIHYGSRCYSGQFSNDGNFFFSCNQDLRVRMYDTSNPYDWKYYKQVVMPYGQWTITDASLTADNKWLAYSSMSHIICLASTDPSSESEPRALDMSRSHDSPARRARHSSRWFSTYSVRFSGDGREIVAGTGDNSIYVFDIERDHTVLRIPNHDDDVNAVCFGDPNSPHILYSGSDDCTVKVWDRRSMGDGRAAGVFLGHTEGVTFVDSAGDGRYVISNGKDQQAKLWDLRKVMGTDRADKINTYKYSQGWDYRGGGYDIRQWREHPHDCSLVTFRGHAVEKTLIRCHFSPLGSTDKRYIYSGSADGKVYVWNMDATLKGTIDVGQSTSYLRERDSMDLDYHWGSQGSFGTVIRDVSWHPSVPMVAATAWNGWGTGMGTCSIHSWNDGMSSDDSLTSKGVRVNAQLHPENDDGTPIVDGENESGSGRTRQTRRRRAI